MLESTPSMNHHTNKRQWEGWRTCPLTVRLWLVLAAALCGSSLPSVQGVPINGFQGAVLLSLQNSWGQRFDGWGGGNECSTASGLRCDENGNIIAMDVPQSRLTGNIPEIIGALTALTYLSLPRNQLNGSIPISFGALTNLQFVDFGYNGLTGSIPESLRNLTNLTCFSTYNNKMTGTIPAFFGALTKLKHLSLAFNQLTGIIPESLGALQGVTHLSLRGNSLTGSIPASLGGLGSLSYLALSYNQLTGSIVSSLGSIPNLQYLDVSQNNLTGTIPASLGSLIRLQALDLGVNRLSGTIPEVLQALTGLTLFSTYGNQLTGSIPSFIGALTNLQYLDLSFNQFSGNIPGSFGGLTSLRMLGVRANQLTGSIPASLSTLSNLLQLILSRNELSGVIPDFLGALVNLQYVDLGYNQLTGSIPQTLSNLKALTAFSTYVNELTGSIPTWLGALTNLRHLNLGSSQLTGSIPDSIGFLASLTLFSTYSNQLTGTIPASFASLKNIQYLNLGFNSLTGSIPESIGTLTGCTLLGFFRNHLSGSIPASLGALTKAKFLNMDGNYFTGSIPSSLGNLLDVVYLSMSENDLYGTIPDSLCNLAKLTSLILASNQLTGTIPSRLGSLTNLRRLDLSENLLAGAVPGTLGNLQLITLMSLAGSYGTIRCPEPRSLCWVNPKSDAFQQSYFCTSICPMFCKTCVPGIPNAAESKGLSPELKQLNGRRNPYFRYASLLGDPAAPRAVDWRITGHVFSIKDQGNCSSCWAFSAVAAVETAVAISLDRQAISLSEQQLLDCIGVTGIDCTGGLPEIALNYIANMSANGLIGILPADFYPYRATKKECTLGSQLLLPTPIRVAMYEEVEFFGWFGITLAVQNQPVIANLRGSHPSFMKYNGAELIYADETCATGVVDHSVVIVGYNLNSSPPYWIIRNSAGPSWGREGYMNIRIIKGNGICDIQSTPVLYPVITSPKPCESPMQPCGAGTCLDDDNIPPLPGRNKCDCPPGFINVTNIDLSTSCAPVDVCNFYSRNPCGVGTCVNDNLGGYKCICPMGYADGNMASDNSATCISATLVAGRNLTYVVEVSGITCATVAAAFSRSEAQLRQQNRQLTDDLCLNLPSGTSINVTGTGLVQSCNVRYSWSKGDTCELVASLTAVPLARIRLLNPWLNCTTGLLPSSGQQICLDISSQGDPNGTLPRCNVYVAVNSSDTCARIIAKFGMSPLKFFALNPGLFCDSIGARSNLSAALPPIDEVCIDGGMQGVQQCRVGFSVYNVSIRDTCERLVTRFFQGSWSAMAAANGNWQCKRRDLFKGRKICVPCMGAGCPRPPPPVPKKARQA